MNSSDLKTEQVEQLPVIIGRHCKFYSRMIERMNRVGFTPDDPLMRAAIAAHDAGCGVGRT